MNTLVRPRTSRSKAHDADRADESDESDESDERKRTTSKARVRDADGMAVASFVMGLAGLLVFNVVLGPCALVLAGLALMRGTTRRTRAVLGLTLGAADLVVLAVVASADQTLSWSIAG
jgi:hypothetical protein